MFNPFKLKKELCDDTHKILSISESIFGRPVETDVNQTYRNTEVFYKWKIFGGGFIIDFTISHANGWDMLGMTYDVDQNERIEPVFQDQEFLKKVSSKVEFFINEIKKPWSDWTLDDFLNDHPMWIFYFYLESGKEVPEVLHNKMILDSFDNDYYVKRYLSLWQQKQNSTEQPSPA